MVGWLLAFFVVSFSYWGITTKPVFQNLCKIYDSACLHADLLATLLHVSSHYKPPTHRTTQLPCKCQHLPPLFICLKDSKGYLLWLTFLVRKVTWTSKNQPKVCFLKIPSLRHIKPQLGTCLKLTQSWNWCLPEKWSLKVEFLRYLEVAKGIARI